MLPFCYIFPKSDPILGKKHAKNGIFLSKTEHFSSKIAILITEIFLYLGWSQEPGIKSQDGIANTNLS